MAKRIAKARMRNISPEHFCSVWQNVTTVDEVSSKLSIPNTECSQLAARMRRRGVGLRTFRAANIDYSRLRAMYPATKAKQAK